MLDPELLDDSDLHRLESIVADYTERRRKGEQPRVEEYVQSYPDLAKAIRDTLPALKKLRDLSPPLDSDSAPAKEWLPRKVGDYRILGELGRGGMGVVYHAVQESLNRTVALKVLPRSGLFDERRRERFRREARIAAQLHHTNIVPIFGTGQTDEVDYIAMQYIEGESLDRVIGVLRELQPAASSLPDDAWPQAHDGDRVTATAVRLLQGRLAADATAHADLPIASSISRSSSHGAVTGFTACVAQIGAQAAQALSHSHAHGVLHRDIKPSNLILDGSGRIWVTDFGLARHDEQGGLTSTGDLVGTLRYMAPECLKGEIDPRTDIYALGLTLFELLTFRPALDERDRGRLIQRIAESEPAFPAEAKRSIPRDLQTIVLKAMAKEPGDRYASAQALAADLERFLVGKAVSAHPLGAFGRTWRWCRRNRVVTGLATSLLLVLTVSLAVVLWQWRRAEANLALAELLRARAEANLVEAEQQRRQAELNFQRARQAVDDYLITVSEDTLLDVPTLEPVRAALLQRAKEFYEGFVRQRADDPELQAELAASYIRLGQIEHDLDGDWLPLLTRGLQIVEELAEQGVSFTEFRSWRNGVYNTRSGYLKTSDVDKFRPAVNRALAIWEPLVEKHPEVDGFRADLAGLFLMRGMVHFNVEEYDAAYADFERSLELRLALAEQHPDVEKYRYALGESYTTCGMVKIRTEKFGEALHFSSKAKELLEPIAEANPAATRLADILAAIHQWIALAHLRMNDPIRALAAYQQALDIQEKLSREYPYEPKFQLNLANSYCMLGRSFFEAGQPATATKTYARCFDLLRQRIDDYPDTQEYRGALVNAYLDLSNQLYNCQDFPEAEQAARDALEWTDTQTAEERARQSRVHFRIAATLEAQSKLEQADESFERAIAAVRTNDQLHRHWLATYLERSARVKYRLQQYHEAEAAIGESLNIRRESEDAPPHLAAAATGLHARILEQLERYDEAEVAWRNSLEIARKQGDLDAAYARDAAGRLVDLMRRGDDFSGAEGILAELRCWRAAQQGAEYGFGWTITVYDLDDDAPADGRAKEEWNEHFQGAPVATMQHDALDLVWYQQPFAAGVPSGPLAVRAECEWNHDAGEVELHLRYGERVRVYLDDAMIFESSADDSNKHGTINVAAPGRSVQLKVEHVQRRPGRAQLQLWAVPAEQKSRSRRQPGE